MRAEGPVRWVVVPVLLAACADDGSSDAPDVSAEALLASVVLEPEAPVVGDTIRAHVTLLGHVGDPPPALRLVFEVDGVVAQQGPLRTLVAGFAKHQQVVVRVVAERDGSRDELISAPVVVRNTPPQVPRVVVDPPLARAHIHDLVCRPEGTPADADGDPLRWRFVWWRDGERVVDGPIDGLRPGDTVPADLLRDGETWSCTPELDDGEVVVPGPAAERRVAVGVRPRYGVPEVGTTVACVLAEDGEATCWGQDGADGLASPPPGPYVRLWVSDGFACGLRADDLSLACWGAERAGRLAPPPGPFLDAALGPRHGCAVGLDQEPVCWGDDGRGQTSPPRGAMRALGAGGAATCGLDPAGRITCWGAVPFGGPPADGGWAQVVLGTDHGCALALDGRVACWGSDVFGQASPPPGRWLALGARAIQTCGLRADGVVACWGESTLDLPLGATSLSLRGGFPLCARTRGGVTCRTTRRDGLRGRFGEDAAPTERLHALAVGDGITCGLDAGGRASCLGTWGAVGVPDVPLTALTAGSDVGCGLDATGHARCWGWLDRRVLGEPPDEPLVALAVGDGAACGTRSDGTLTCWGARAPEPPDEPLDGVVMSDDYGCGLRADRTARCFGPDDARTRPPLDPLIALAAGPDHACGLRPSGRVLCWGRAGKVPTPPAGGAFVALSVGRGHACGLEATGRVRCWGHSDEAAHLPPEDVPLVALDGGEVHHCGLRADGGLVCWGAMRREPLP